MSYLTILICIQVNGLNGMLPHPTKRTKKDTCEHKCFVKEQTKEKK